MDLWYEELRRIKKKRDREELSDDDLDLINDVKDVQQVE